MGNLFGRKRKTNKKRIAGSIRQNQLITAFGVGSIIDFIKDTVIIAGVDDWDGNNEELRLYNENLQSLTGVNYFLQPKTAQESYFFNKSEDIPAYVFPEKLYCPNCKKIIDVKELQDQNKPHQCFACGNPNLVASRFVVICENGHMEDFPYSWWVHKGNPCTSGKENPRIEMFNISGKSGIDGLMVKCLDCGLIRPMQGAFLENALAGEKGYACSGYHPHLKNPHHFPKCASILKLRLRTSSSVYFPVVLSALSIPPWSREAVKAIFAKYDHIKFIDPGKIDDYLRAIIMPGLSSKINLADLKMALKLVSKNKERVSIKTESDIYQDEYQVLSRDRVDEGEYSSYTVKTPAKYKKLIEQITIVDRLTEIQTLRGFTRLKPWNGDLAGTEQIVPLAMVKKDWLPAVKLNGEGIFIRLSQEALTSWTKRIGNRYQKMANNLDASYLKNKRFASQYIALHTLSHLLMRQISDQCGYSLASLKEKIYSNFYDQKDESINMNGILIYLATPDSDGSLGGLISIAEDVIQLERIVDNMLEKALWCSGDPLCINATEQGLLSLNYAACHDCTLLPETSCEFRNVLLDRVSIVGTLENRGLGLFGEMV